MLAAAAPPARPAAGPRPRHRHRLRRAQRARRPARRRRSPARTRPSTRSPPRRQALREFFQVAPTFENEAHADPQPPRRVPARTPGRWSRTCCRSPTTSARRCAASGSSRRTCGRCSSTSTTSTRASQARASRRSRARSQGLRPVLDNLDPFLANLNPVVSLAQLLPVRTSPTSSRTRRSASPGTLTPQPGQPSAAPRAAPARLHHPGVARDLPEPPAREPRQRLPAARTTSIIKQGEAARERDLPELRLRQHRRRASALRRRRRSRRSGLELRALLRSRRRSRTSSAAPVPAGHARPLARSAPAPHGLLPRTPRSVYDTLGRLLVQITGRRRRARARAAGRGHGRPLRVLSDPDARDHGAAPARRTATGSSSASRARAGGDR